MAGPHKSEPPVGGRGSADHQTQLAAPILPAAAAASNGEPVLRLVMPPPKDWPTRVMTHSACPGFVVGKGHPPPIEWSVEGWAQAGKAGVLVAAGGTGKTTLVLLLAVCHATGRPFMGRAVRQGKVVILSNDDTQEDLDATLALVVRACELTERELLLVEFGVVVVSTIGLDGVKTFAATVEGRPQATDMLYHLQDATADMGNLVLVVLDTARQFAGGPTNDEQVVKLLIGGAAEFAAKRGCYVVIPHHTGKANYRDAVTDMYAASGSAAISDNARFVWLLMRVSWGEIADKVQRTANEDGDPLVLMSTRGSLRVRAPDPVYMVRDGYSIRPIAGNVMSKDQQADQKDLEVLRAVRGGAQSQVAVTRVVRGRRQSTLDRIENLLQRGHLIDGGNRSGTGSAAKLQVSESGARWLDSAP